MPVPVLFPKVSLEESEGKISRWLVAAGAQVKAGQVIFEIENDKAAVEVEAPADGILSDPVAEGQTVRVGDPVARILGEAAEATVAPAPRTAETPPVAPAKVATPPARAPSAPASERAPNPTPLARRIARERGVSLQGLTGTGPRGRVQRSDVIAHLARLAGPVPASRAAALAAEGTERPGAALNAVWLRRGTGIPLVLLHGYSGDLNNWRGLFAGARTERPVLALDLPGHGGSAGVPATGGLDGLAALVEATLAGLAVEQAILCGHSFGGALAARLAARGQLDVKGLCLFAPAGLSPGINGAFTAGILQARQAESLRPWLEQLVHDPAIITEPFLRAVVKAREDADLTAAMSDFAGRFFPDATQSFAIRADLAGLRIPVRVIFGRQDRILPFDSTRGLPGNVGLHALDECGHMPHLEHPALCLALLEEVARSA